MDALRPPGPNERIVDENGKPSRVHAAFLRDVAVSESESRDRLAKLEAHLVAEGVIEATWAE